jgi:hypothetical protein
MIFRNPSQFFIRNHHPFYRMYRKCGIAGQGIFPSDSVDKLGSRIEDVPENTASLS